MATFIVGIVIVIWLVLAIRYTLKHSGKDGCSGGCTGCSDKSACETSNLYESYRKDHKKPV